MQKVLTRAGRLRRRLAHAALDLVYGRPRTEVSGTYAIGIYAGDSPLRLRPAAGCVNPVLDRRHVTDVDAAFVADPFMIRVDDLWHMFFEVYNRRSGRGEIGCAVSRDARRWTYLGIVLREPFHLSYPYVFAWRGDVYMVPETCAVKAVRLYRARRFPAGWEVVGDLLSGFEAVDPSLCRWRDTWWMFVGEGRPPFHADYLRLFRAGSIEGPWREHPRSPVVRGNPRRGRPAGRVVVTPEGPIRYSQDCQSVYGARVYGFEVADLGETSYRERSAPAPVLTGSGSGWNAAGMHHVDAHAEGEGRWIACVDGWCVEPACPEAGSLGSAGSPSAASALTDAEVLPASPVA